MIIHNRLISSVNGPGRRAVIWVQGCDLGCRGCWNPATHSHLRPDNETPEELARWILVQDEIEGVTFSGGEPLQQAQETLAVLEEVKRRSPELTAGMFTGYNLEELETGRFKYRARPETGIGSVHSQVRWVTDQETTAATWRSVRALLDFAVVGRFQESRKTTADPMRSSTNQTLRLFSGRYREGDFPRQAVEVKIRLGGLTTITGFPIGARL